MRWYQGLKSPDWLEGSGQLSERDPLLGIAPGANNI